MLEQAMEGGSYQIKINYQFPFRMLCSDREGIQCPIQPWNSSPTLRLYLQPWIIDGSSCLVLGFCFRVPVSSSRCVLLLLQDLANQIRWSRVYRLACEKSGVSPSNGKYLSPEAGEWFSGLPTGWTSPVPGSVDPKAFDSAFPDAKTAWFSVSTGLQRCALRVLFALVWGNNWFRSRASCL